MSKYFNDKRENGDLLCPHHRGKEVIFICKGDFCAGQLICSKCTTTIHRGHKHTALDELVAMRTRRRISGFIDDAEKKEQAKLKGQMRYVEEKIDEKRKLFPHVVHKIRQHGEHLKHEIEAIINKFIAMCGRLETETMDAIHGYKKQIFKMYAELNALVYECKKTLRSGSYVQLYDTDRKCTLAVQLPQFPIMRHLDFEPLETPDELLEHSFGTMLVKTDYGPNVREPTNVSMARTEDTAVTDDRENDFDDEDDRRSTRSQLLEETEVVCEFNYPYDISKVCPISDHAWVSYWERPEILLMNQRGKVKTKYVVDFEVWDISVSRITNNVWMCCRQDCSIRELTTTLAKTPRKRFNTGKEPWCFVVTDDNKVVVGMTQDVTQFNLEGRVLNVATVDKYGKRIVISPRSLTECPVTRNIAVADFDMVTDEGEGKPRVVVLDHHLNHVFSYRKKTKKLPKDTILELSRFNPWGITYDSNGDIVIADFNNDCILLISGKGQFLKTLLLDVHNSPIALGIQTDNLLWVIFDYHDMKVLKYED